MPIVKLEGLIHGHYECKSLNATLPIFQDLLACEIVEKREKSAVVQHPNTSWQLIIHEGGASAPDKPHANHYGFRVADHQQIEAAYDYISQNAHVYGLTNVSKPSASHFAYSIYMDEPGGNTIEIEYYNPNAADRGREVATRPWTTPLPVRKFPGKGYIPQALSHGTAQCDVKEASNEFYTEVLGLTIKGGGRYSTYIGHDKTPWYIVILPAQQRSYLRPANRYTLLAASSQAVRTAHGDISRKWGEELQLSDLFEDNGQTSFFIKDLDRNWWEITSDPSPNHSPAEGIDLQMQSKTNSSWVQ